MNGGTGEGDATEGCRGKEVRVYRRGHLLRKLMLGTRIRVSCWYIVACASLWAVKEGADFQGVGFQD